MFISKKYELDVRNKGELGLKIKSSVKKIWIKLYKLFKSPLTCYQDFYASTDQFIHQVLIIIWNNVTKSLGSQRNYNFSPSLHYFCMCFVI
ncbi:hypothetical protein LXL04_031816 [Taraxacum kok-saghyz]